MYYSGQAGTLREANLDFHKAGFTPKSLRGVLGRIPGLKVVDVVTSDGNVSNWKEHTFPDETGYNIIAIVEKEFHNAPVSIKMNIPQQEAAKKHVGEKAKDFDLDKDIKAKKAEKKVAKKKVGRPKKKVGRPKKLKVEASSVLVDPHDPASALRAVGYDPIIETIKTIKETDQKLRWCKKQSRPSQAAIAALMATKRALNNDLLKFGYRPVPEKIIQENHNFSFGITLTDSDGSDVEVQKVMPEQNSETQH